MNQAIIILVLFSLDVDDRVRVKVKELILILENAELEERVDGTDLVSIDLTGGENCHIWVKGEHLHVLCNILNRSLVELLLVEHFRHLKY